MIVKNIYNISTAHAVSNNEMKKKIHNQFAFIIHTHSFMKVLQLGEEFRVISLLLVKPMLRLVLP